MHEGACGLPPGRIIDERLLADGEAEFVFASPAAQRIAPPASLLRQMAEIQPRRPNPNSLMLPDHWAGIDEPTEAISVRILKNAYVFGGEIRHSDQASHGHGQLLLTSECKLIPASFGVLDGWRTLPVDILRPHPDAPGRYNLRVFGEPADLPGCHYFVGSTHRHFGHFLLEGLSRLWALQYVAPALLKQLRFLIYEDRIPPLRKTDALPPRHSGRSHRQPRQTGTRRNFDRA